MKTVVITGSARGFGYAMLELFYRNDFNVVVCDINKECLQEAKNKLNLVKSKGKVLSYVMDVTKEEDINKLIEYVLSEVKTIDIPTINKRPFVYVGGFGKFLNIAYDTTRESKKKYSYLAYVYNGIKDFFTETKIHDITYTVDGEQKHVEASMMMICNSTRIAGMDSFFKNVKLNDDLFEVYIVTAKKRLDIIRALGLSAFKGPKNVQDVISFRTNNIKLKFKERLKKPWCIDGEKLEINPLTYEIKNSVKLDLLIPKKNINKLFIK